MSDCNPELHLDPRVRRTRRGLLEAFDALMREKTLQSITVGDIAARAEVNRATFYAHFPDKFALFEYALRDRFREVLSAQAPCPSTFRIENLRSFCQAVAQFLGGFGGHCRRSDREFDPLVEATVQTSLQHFLARWWEADPTVRRDDLDAEVFASTVSWTIFGAALSWSRGPRTLPVEEWATQLERLLLAGLEKKKAPVGA